MNNVITANELKVKGVSAIQNATSNNQEALISVRGKNKYIVLSIDEYNYLRECELIAAVVESKKDLKNGNIIKETVDNHITRIIND